RRRPRRTRRPECAARVRRAGSGGADRLRALVLPRRRQRRRGRQGDAGARTGSRGHRFSNPARAAREGHRDRGRRTGRRQHPARAAGSVGGSRTAGWADAGGARGRRRRLHDRERAARTLHRRRAQRRPLGRSAHRHADGRRERTERGRSDAHPAARRDGVGQHHRGVVRHARAHRLFDFPRRFPRRRSAARRRGGGPWRSRRTVRRRQSHREERQLFGRQPAAGAALRPCRRGGPGGAEGGGTWILKSVTVGGTDISDTPFELKPAQNVDNVTVVLTDRTTELAGTVRDAQNAGTSGVTVIAFSTESQYWRAQSRRISTSRTGQTGEYRIRGLPAGDYYVMAVDDVEQGEWFDPAYLDSVKDKATRVTLNEGDKKTLDLRGPS